MDLIKEGTIKKIEPDIIRSKSMFKSAEETLQTIKKIPLEQTTLKTILRELYEGLNEPNIAARFDRYRKLRNGINYYGDEIAPQKTLKINFIYLLLSFNRSPEAFPTNPHCLQV